MDSLKKSFVTIDFFESLSDCHFDVILCFWLLMVNFPFHHTPKGIIARGEVRAPCWPQDRAEFTHLSVLKVSIEKLSRCAGRVRGSAILLQVSDSTIASFLKVWHELTFEHLEILIGVHTTFNEIRAD